jgi:hypothetical protein
MRDICLAAITHCSLYFVMVVLGTTIHEFA